MAQASDISVRPNRDGTLDVSSHLTRGPTATVAFMPDGKPLVVWAVTAAYRQGITESLILAAVSAAVPAVT